MGNIDQKVILIRYAYYPAEGKADNQNKT